jgi:hypothetical protein
LLGDRNVLPLCIPATHKPNRTIHFPHAYAAESIGGYGIDNEALLFTVTASAYNVMRRIFLPMFTMPMRSLTNLCTFRMG